jgi:hypothetical protein
VKKYLLLFIVFVVAINSHNAFANTKCSKGKHWVSAYFRRAYNRHDGTSVKATNVKAYCRKNPKGYAKWHQRLSNKRPKVWGYSQEKSKKWSIENVERLYDAISILPAELINQGEISVYRMLKSRYEGNPATSNFREVVLYDSAFVHKDSLAQIISHELAHVLYGDLGKKEKEMFAQSSSWIIDDGHTEEGYKALKSKIFIQDDSQMGVDEDFSNHIEYFLFRPKYLEKHSPNAFKWIETKYGKKFKIGANK